MTLHDASLPRDDEGRHTDLLQDEGGHGEGGEGEHHEEGGHADQGVASATETLTLRDTDMRRARYTDTDTEDRGRPGLIHSSADHWASAP